MAIEQFDFRGQRWQRITVDASERWIVGVDLGQASDPTAIAVMRHHVTPLDDWTADHAKRITRRVTEDFADVLHLERVPLKTDYGAIAEHVRNILDRDPLRLAERVDLVIDDTGVGRAVGDDMCKRLALNPFRVSITGGDTQTRTTGRKWNVAKGILISGLDAMLSSGQLRFAPALMEAGTLKEELSTFHRSVTGAGRAVYAARVGKHDDLVLAVALCCWRARGNGGSGEVYTGTVAGMY